MRWYSQGVSVENRAVAVLDSSACIGRIYGMVPVGVTAARRLLFDGLLGEF
jgi:hypothetical protein